MIKYFKYPFAYQGDNIAIPDDLQTNGTVSYQQGWGYDYQRRLGTDPLAKPVPRQQTNQLYNDITSAVKQYQEHGFFDFITADINGGQPFSYSMGACVRFDMSETKDGTDIRNFSSKINENIGNPKDNPDDWDEIGKDTVSPYQFTNINTDTALTVSQAGVILIDASANNVTVTVPNTDLNISYIIKRIDNTANTVRVKTVGTDKIRFNLSYNANGYSFFNLYGSGDYWQIISDGLGNWFDINRLDKFSIGDIKFSASTKVPPGGYLIANGALLSRTDHPWLWDFAQQSGMLIDDANRTGLEGCFTRGDGATTFRLPEVRGEFLRALDNSRAVDTSRVAGSWQADAIQNITGTMGNVINYSENDSGAFYSGAGALNRTGTTGATTAKNTYFDASRVVPVANENRPRNIAYPVYIKII